MYEEFLNPKEEEIAQEVDKTPEKEQPENSKDFQTNTEEPEPTPAQVNNNLFT